MYYKENTVVYFNGQWLKAKDLMVNPYVQTMHYGNGVFEGIRSYATPDGTRIFKADEHYQRLLFSAKKMHLKVNYTAEEFAQLTYELLQKNKLSNDFEDFVKIKDNGRCKSGYTEIFILEKDILKNEENFF